MNESSSDRIRRSRSVTNPMKWFGMVMSGFYLVAGLFILFDKKYVVGIPPDLKNIFAILLLIYGIYRGWRVYMDYWRADS